MTFSSPLVSRSHRRRGPEGWRSAVILAAILAVIGGCASRQPVTGAPIADVGAIAGKWAGSMTPGDEPFYLTISPGGTLTAAWGANMAWGTVTTRDGKATFEMQPGLYEGTISLYDNADTRRLVLNDSWSSFNAQVVPQ